MGPELPALVESVYLDAVMSVLLQNLLGVLVCVEGVHENKRNICVVGLVQMLREKVRREV